MLLEADVGNVEDGMIEFLTTGKFEINFKISLTLRVIHFSCVGIRILLYSSRPQRSENIIFCLKVL